MYLYALYGDNINVSWHSLYMVLNVLFKAVLYMCKAMYLMYKAALGLGPLQHIY